MTFSDLYYLVFPYIGEFFGKLCGWATLSCQDLQYWLNRIANGDGEPSSYVLSIPWTNFFTGSTGVMSIAPPTNGYVWKHIAMVGEWFADLLPFYTNLAVGLLITCVEIFFVVLILQFVVKIINPFK